jgi:hypothetical protein
VREEMDEDEKMRGGGGAGGPSGTGRAGGAQTSDGGGGGGGGGAGGGDPGDSTSVGFGAAGGMSLGTMTTVRYTPSSASYLVGSGSGGSTWGTVADANLVSYSSSGDSKRCGNLEATIRSAILAIQNCPDPVDATNVALEILKKGLEA